MYVVSARQRFSILLLTILALALPAFADNVTVSGTVNFSALDGSSLDHDGVVNGVFTVDDGNLTVSGTINCNDVGPGSASACAMSFAVSGDMTIDPGAAIYAENRTGTGNGGDITFNVGGQFLMGALSQPGATISSGNDNNSAGNAGNITINAGVYALISTNCVVSAAAKGGNAGAISVVSGGPVAVHGLIASGPSSTIAATKYTGAVLTGGASSAKGGDITLEANATTEPAVNISAFATVASQGANGGAGKVLVRGCGIIINGLVASVSNSGSGADVTVVSGTSLAVNGNNLGGAGIGVGRVRADAMQQGGGTNVVNLFAREGVSVSGPAAGTLYSVSANGGSANKDASGTINVISTDGGAAASGNAFAAMGSDQGDQGGTINVSGATDLNLNTANLNASGDFVTGSNDRAGGKINVRSYSGAVSWQAGSGDVRPTGSASGIAVAKQGTISITYCTSVSTTGSTFPTNGAPTGAFPTTTQTCSPAAPSLPNGVSLPDCNDPPVANDDNYDVDEGGTINEPAPGVLGNDTDPDADPITAILVSGPAHASSFTFNADGSFDYTHDGSETTSDSFTYQASDGMATSNVATVFITINPVNDAPVAVDDNYNVSEGGTLNYAAPGVLANDTDVDGPTMTAILVSGPAHATSFALNADGSFVYEHDGSETTSDSFTYKANDSFDDSNVATAFITIDPVNDAPVANDDNDSVAEGGTLNGASVLTNDTDAENDSLTAILVSSPLHASSFTFNNDGTYTYVHDGGESTSDSFTYKANDGSLDSNVATVDITITPVNDPPVAFDDNYGVTEGGTLNGSSVLDNDTDAENDTLTAVLVSGPAHAQTFVLNADGTFTYVHDGDETATSDSFTYKANDGTDDSNVATVSITITLVNDTPTAVDDTFNTVGNTELRVGTGASSTPHVAVTGSVLDNDTDGDTPHSSLSIASYDGTSANGGTITMNPDGTFTYFPPVLVNAPDTFNYVVTDGNTSDTGTVTITFTGRVWYVRNNAGSGDGRSHSPFNNLTAAESMAQVNDTIFIHRGDGTIFNHMPITLQDGQRLIGEGVALVVGPYTLWPAGLPPTINAVTLANGNTVAGVNITSSGVGISGSSVNGGTIYTVNISGGTDGIDLSSVTGSFTITDTTVAPGGIGISITGTANVTMTNTTVTTSGSTGIIGSGSGTVSFNGGSVSTTNGTAVSLTNHNVGGTGLTSVSASNAVNGIVLSGTSGTFIVNGTGTNGSGGTITGMSNLGVSAVNAKGMTLKWMSINNSGQQGVLVTTNLATATNYEVSNSSFSGNFSNGVQSSNSGTGSMTWKTNANSFASNNGAVILQTLSGPMTAKITNNVATFNAATPFVITRSNTGTGAVEVTLTGNTVGTAGVTGSGATCGGACNGMAVTGAGSGTFLLLLSNNDIRHVDAIGVRVFANVGSTSMAATITNNVITEPEPDVIQGLQVQSGSTSTDTTSLCAHIAGNTISGGWFPDITVRNFAAGSTFSVPGYMGLGTDTTAVANFIKAQNTVTTVTATRKTTAPANQFSGGPACATPAP